MPKKLMLNFPSMNGDKTEKFESHEDRLARLVEASKRPQTTKGGRPLLDLPSMRTPTALAEQAVRDAAEQKDRDAHKAHAKEMAYLQEHKGSIDRIKYPIGEFAKQVLEEEQ